MPIGEMLDKVLEIHRRPGDVDPVDRIEDPYGDRIDAPLAGAGDPVVVLVAGAYESRALGAAEITDAGGRNAGLVGWTLYLDPDADVARTDVIVERSNPEDPSSPEIHRFDLRSVDLVTDFAGVPSHWEIESQEHS